MPDERYANYLIVRVPFSDSIWLPETCHNCHYYFSDDSLYFFDVCYLNGLVLNDAMGFCSSVCCREYIDVLNEGIHANYERPYFHDLDPHYVEMQEEATED